MVIGLISAGATVVIFNIIDTSFIPDQLGLVLDVSGMLISSVGFFPFKDIVDKKNKIKHVNLLKLQYNSTHIGEKKKIEKLIWKMVEKDILD